MPEPSPMVVVYPRGQLNEADKQSLREAGIIALEADDPGLVRVLPAPIQTPHPVQYDDMLMAALDGLAYTSGAQSKFVNCLHDRLRRREKEEAAKRLAGEGA